MDIFSAAYCLMKSVIHEELASGIFLQAKAQALRTKSFTDSLYAPSESRFNCFRTLNDKTEAKESYNNANSDNAKGPATANQSNLHKGSELANQVSPLRKQDSL